ncbi:MAG: hypothetical protein GX111_04740 [Clostridiales bacterium]|nr:hypothetical protein [Clostridiales bacterium]
MNLLVIIIFGLLALYDFSSLVKKKKWYEVEVLLFFYVFVFTLAMLTVNGVKLPSPAKGAQHLIVDILKIGYPKP